MTRAVVAGLDARAGLFPIRLTEGDALPFTIEFTEADGATPTPLDAGAYLLEVRAAAGAPVAHTVALTRGGTGNNELAGVLTAELTSHLGSSRTAVHDIVNTTTSSTILAGPLEIVPRGEAGAGWPDNLARVVGLPGPAGPAGSSGLIVCLYDFDTDAYPARPDVDVVFWLGPTEPPAWVWPDSWIVVTAPTEPATVPGAPTNVVATAGVGQVSLIWDAPASDGGSAITAYIVTPYIAGIDQTPVTVGNIIGTTITGLTPGTPYTFTVVAVNPVGSSAQSTPSAPATPTAGTTVPGAPTNVAATAGNAQAVVTWDAPASDGGSAITGYTVRHYIAGVLAGTNTVGNVLTATITGLTNGTAYTFTAAATNAIGTGSASSASSAVTPTAPAVAPTKVQASPWAEGGSGTLSTTCTLPAAPTVGNTLILVQYSWKSAAEMPVPAGWTVDEVSSSSTRTIRVLRRTVQTGDPTTWTTTTTVGIHQGCMVMEWTPCVLDSHSTATILTGAGATVLGPTAAPTAPAVVILGIVTGSANIAWNTSSPAYTEADATRALAAHSAAVTTAQSVSVTPASSAVGTAALLVYRGA